MALALSVPNLLTFLRLLLLPLAVWLFRIGRPTAAAALFVVAMLTDCFDGFLASLLSQRTALGSYLDPVVDKIVILVFFYELAFAGILPFAIAHLFLARELLQNGIRAAAASRGKVIGANWMGKTKSALQSTVITACLLEEAITGVFGLSDAASYRLACSYAAWAVLALSWLFFIRFAAINRSAFLGER